MSDIISKFNNGMNNTPRVKQQNAVPAMTKTNLLSQYNSTNNTIEFRMADGTLFFALNLTSGTMFTNSVFSFLHDDNTFNGIYIGEIGGATGDKIGFFGNAPIFQPLLATGTAKTVDNVITVLQNLGLVRQT